MRSRRLPLPRCRCGAWLSKADRVLGLKICAPCEAKVEQEYRALAQHRAGLPSVATVSST